MKRLLLLAIQLSVAALIAAGAAHWLHLPFWPAVLIAVGATAVNGCIATLEDDLPGGFNNPDGTHTPRYVTAVAWAVRTFGVLAAVLLLLFVFLYFFGSK
jgi:hypothetical protein